MYLHCIRSLRFSEGSWYFFLQHTDFVNICYILRVVFPIFFHCIRSLHFLRAVSNSFLDQLVYIRYIYLGGFPMYLHCIRSLHFSEDSWCYFFSTYRSCIHLLHLMGCFSYIFPLYTFVTLFRGFLIVFFFNIQILYTSVTSYGMFFLCISIVYVRYTFWELYLILF